MMRTVGKIFSKRNLQKNIFLMVILAVPVAHFIIFWGVLNFNSILLAFRHDVTGDATFKHFRLVWELLQNDYGMTRLRNTLLTWTFMTVFLLPWGFIVTYFLYKKIPLAGVWRTALFIPSIIPAVAMVTIFSLGFFHSGGFVGRLFEAFGGQVPFFFTNPKISPYTVLIYIFWTNFGGSFILFSGAMSRIPKEVLESARLDGAGMRVELMRIVLPLCWPTFSMLLLLNLAGLFTVSGPLVFLTGIGGAVGADTISYWIFSNVDGGGVKALSEMAALGTMCTLALFPIVLFARWGLGKIYADVEF